MSGEPLLSSHQTLTIAGQDDMLAQVSGHNSNMAKLISILSSRFALGAFTGTFAMPAAITKTVADTNVKANSIIIFVPTNTSAAQLQGSAKQLYVSAKAAGVSFDASTGSLVAAAGTETFSYVILNVG